MLKGSARFRESALRESFSNTLSSFVVAAAVLFCTTVVLGQERIVPQESVESLRGLLMRNQSDFWLGVFCTRAPAALQSHLELDRDEGLVVRRVVKGSPAAKADLRVHDVVLKFGDTTVASVPDLVSAIDAAGGQENVVTLIRGGQEMTLVVTPEKRLASGQTLSPPDFDSDLILKWVDEFYQNDADDDLGGFRFRFFHPGETAEADSDEAVGAEFNLPRDLNITIAPDETGEPVIRVEKDGEEWEVTSEDLADLPNALAPFVEQFLGRMNREETDEPRQSAKPALPDIQFEDPADGEPPQEPSVDSRGLEKQIENLERMLRDLRDEIRKMSHDQTD